MEAEEPRSKKLKISHIVSLPGDSSDTAAVVCAPLQAQESETQTESHSHGDFGAQISPPSKHTSIMSGHDVRGASDTTEAAADTVREPDTGQSSESNVERQLRHVQVDVSEDPASAAQPTISKNQLKRLKRRQDWEDKSQYRKTKRKQKIIEKRERKRAAKAEASTTSTPTDKISSDRTMTNSTRPIQVPITFLLDCQYDEYMLEKERISLGSQLTRCYSDNRSAPLKAHMLVSSFHGPLKERFETVLSNTHKQWKGVKFSEEDLLVTAEESQKELKAEGSGIIAGALCPSDDQTTKSDEQLRVEGEIIYLSSDSPNTLTELKPYSTYIIGGLVDRNRAKGLCYQKAMADGIPTAKLPIGEYIQMASRSVLATNHVFEIMLKWLELGNWAEAFLQVIPKRKGGTLRHTGEDNFDEVVEDSSASGIPGDEATPRAEGEGDSDGYGSNGHCDGGHGNGEMGHIGGGEDHAEGGDMEVDEI